MGLRDLERAIERGVDGVLGRVFRAEVTQLEINSRVERELDAGMRAGERGDRVMPNDIEVRIHPADADRLDDSTTMLQKELIVVARKHARDHDCTFEGPLVVRIHATDEAQRGTIEVYATAEQSVDGTPPGTLVYPNGFRLDLTQVKGHIISLGRDPQSHIEIDDEKASRHHARLRATDRGWLIEDLGSTNGTRVNGFRTTAQQLHDGDQIAIGATMFLFDAS